MNGEQSRFAGRNRESPAGLLLFRSTKIERTTQPLTLPVSGDRLLDGRMGGRMAGRYSRERIKERLRWFAAALPGFLLTFAIAFLPRLIPITKNEAVFVGLIVGFVLAEVAWRRTRLKTRRTQI